VLARQPPVVRVVAHRVKHLRRDDERVARILRQHRAHPALGLAVAVHVGQIVEVHTALVRGADDLPGLIFRYLALEVDPAAESDGADLQTAVTQMSVLHACASLLVVVRVNNWFQVGAARHAGRTADSIIAKRDLCLPNKTLTPSCFAARPHPGRDLWPLAIRGGYSVPDLATQG